MLFDKGTDIEVTMVVAFAVIDFDGLAMLFGGALEVASDELGF